MVDVSIIIVNWNTEILLIDCIESIIKETLDVSYEIIVVDNASSDNSVQSVKNKFPDLKIIENTENYGFAKANNQGIAISSGRYICLINSDVIVLENSIDKLVKHADSDNSIGVIAPSTVDSNYGLRENVRRFPNLWHMFCETFFLHRILKKSLLFHGKAIAIERYNELYEVESISGCFMMVNRTAMTQVGTLDEAFFFYTEDVDWCRRFHDAGWKVIYLSNVKSIHIGGESSNVAPAKYQIIMEKSDLIYWKKYNDSFKLAVYIFLRILKCSFSILSLRLFKSSEDEVKRKARIEGFQARINFLKEEK